MAAVPQGSMSTPPVRRGQAAAALLRRSRQLRVKPDSTSGPIYLLARWPIVSGLFLVILVQALLYFLVRSIVTCWEWITRRNRAAYKELTSAATFEHWKLAAEEMGTRQGKSCSSSWTEEESVILGHTQTLSRLNELGGSPAVIREICEELSMSCKAPWASTGFEYEVMFSRTHAGTNSNITAHVHAAVKALNKVSESTALSDGEKTTFFQRLGTSYGQSALLLSGGAANGFYHLGLIKHLLEEKLLPDVISGSSAGALMAALVCTRRDNELLELLNDTEELCFLLSSNEEPMSVKLGRLWREGVLFDDQIWTEKLIRLTRGEPMTFKEAFDLTGRALCISVFDGRSRSSLLSHLSAPNVLIYSAVLASAAIPHVLSPQTLKCKAPDGSIVPYDNTNKLWRDGSIKEDLPFTKLQQMFNLNFTIVSQVEPHLVPFFYNKKGSAGEPTKHRSGAGWRGGFLLAYFEDILKKEMRKWLSVMRDFDLLPAVFGCNWSNLWLQQTHGNVNIVPPLRLWDYFKLVSHPSAADMHRYMVTMERAAWRKSGWIRAHRTIELAIRALQHATAPNPPVATGVSAVAGAVAESTQETLIAQLNAANHEKETALAELLKVVEVSEGLTQQVRTLRRRGHVYHAVILGFIILIQLVLWDLTPSVSTVAFSELSSSLHSLFIYFGQALCLVYIITMTLL